MNNHLDIVIGKRVRILRKKNKLTLQELAEKLDITYFHLSRLELGQRRWNLSLLFKVSKIFNVPLSAIIDIEQNSDELFEVDKELSELYKELFKLSQEQLKVVIKINNITEKIKSITEKNS